MKAIINGISVEGTPIEIVEYARKMLTPFTPEKDTLFPSGLIQEDILKAQHFSTTKSEYVYMEDMNPFYLVNALRRLIQNFSNKELMGGGEKEFVPLLYHTLVSLLPTFYCPF